MSDITPQNSQTQIDPDDLDKNFSGNPTMKDVLDARMHRRYVLKGGVGAMTMAGLGTLGLTACGGGDDAPTTVTPAAPPVAAAPRLAFTAVNKAITDRITVPAGYTATVIYATGDTIDANVTPYANNGTDASFARRSGDHHDGMHLFGLSAAGQPEITNNDRGLLVINHENITGTAQFFHPAGQTNIAATAGPRPQAEVDREIAAHGVSVIELARTAGRLGYVRASAFNRRITGATLMNINGPARATGFTRTVFSPTGTQTRGTVNNCGHGYTPWGTYLACEENWAGYFIRGADTAQRTQKDNNAQRRNGINPGTAGFAHNRWASVVAPAGNTDYSRWDMTAVAGQPADGTGDFRNVANTFGYVVEIDPYDGSSIPVKRTALGRRSNEGAWASNAIVGQPIAFYIGCDSRGEYIYKYVSRKLWVASDANRGDRLTVGNEYMDDGTIYAARFNADGNGVWVPLTLTNPDVAAGVPASLQNPEGYRFDSLADICVNTRLAADAAGATRMDRPEWTAVNPRTGEIYITCTENPDRGNTAALAGNNFVNPGLDAANPRYWIDAKGVTTQNAAPVPAQRGNVNGHIMRIRESGGDNPGATTFQWDIFLFGAQANADTGFDNVNWQANVNISGLSPLNDLSKPDGCWFSRASGILWIETDDNTFTDQSNAMLLAAVPGTTGDGGPRNIVNSAAASPNRSVTTDITVRTYAGRPMTDATFRRFMTGPLGAEITGLTETPDGRALFVNIQHPGENTSTAAYAAGTFESNWPANGGGVPAYGPGGATGRPRSATVMITKDDGGIIGL